MPSVIYHPAYRNYDFGKHHPFSPVRVEMALDLLDALGYTVNPVQPEPATRADILSVHEENFVNCVEALSSEVDVPDSARYGLGTRDNPVFPGMDEAARWIAGGTLHGARLIEQGERRVLQLGGGLHHARRDVASGFCIYNDLAVAIRYLSQRGFWVAYLDVDVHHGDGQQILYEDMHVMTVSSRKRRHSFPVRAISTSSARPDAALPNIPLEPFTEGEILETFEKVMSAALGQFRRACLSSGRSGCVFDDPLADRCRLRTTETLFNRILHLADIFAAGECCSPRRRYSLCAAPRIMGDALPDDHDLPVPERGCRRRGATGGAESREPGCRRIMIPICATAC